MNPPKIFISATSGDLHGIRQFVKEALLTINCHPVERVPMSPKLAKASATVTANFLQK